MPRSVQTEVLESLEVGAGALLGGMLRGKFERADGSFALGLTGIDAELVIGVALIGGALAYDASAKSPRKEVLHLIPIGQGVLAGYLSRVGRALGKSGELKLGQIGAAPDAAALSASSAAIGGPLPRNVLDAIANASMPR